MRQHGTDQQSKFIFITLFQSSIYKTKVRRTQRGHQIKPPKKLQIKMHGQYYHSAQCAEAMGYQFKPKSFMAEEFEFLEDTLLNLET